VTAVEHARTALNSRPDTSQYYINYLVMLLAADDYEQLLKEASERQKSGFQDSREEHFTRAISAIAYAERGNFSLADEQVQMLFANAESYADAVAAEISVAKRRGLGDKERAGLLRGHLTKLPRDPYILTILVHHLLPPSEDTADELIECLNVIRDHRQLSPDEIFALGRAYLLKQSLDEAELVFRSGRVRYANDPRFLLELAHVYVSKGDEESAYGITRDYIKPVGTDPIHYWNLGLLARATGRLRESISILQKALSRERDPVVIRKIHFLLFDSKRREVAPAKELLRHVISFGELTAGDPDEEARFLLMAFLIPSDGQDFEDPQVREWTEKIRARLEAFVTAHPKSKVLRRMTLPEGVSDERQGLYFLAEVIALQLPQHLASVQIELAARGQLFPLVFRKKFLGHRSVFDYWEFCSRSTEFAHAIHIWYESSDFNAELNAVNLNEPVCVDISALLTLQALGLLDDLASIFPEIVLSRGTVRAIRDDLTGLDNPHQLAVQLDAWLQANRSKIRIRPAYGVPDFESQPDASYIWNGTIWTPAKRSFAQFLSEGVGESIIVAQQTGCALYCDDVSVRASAINEYKVRSLSTLALMNVLRNRNRLSLANEAGCLAKLVTFNFRHVRFSANHLHDRLIVTLKSLSTERRPITIGDLNSDATLGVLLRQFGDREITDLSLIQVASDWWATLIRDDRIPDNIAGGLIASLTYKLSQRTLDNVLEKVAKHRPLHRIATIWAFFMIRLFNSGKEEELPRVWSTLKTAASEVVRDEKQFDHVLFELVPMALHELISKAAYLDDDQKAIALFSIPKNFHPADRERFEAKISRLLF
jgi:tetratricopeptide (TPR) repeat protein